MLKLFRTRNGMESQQQAQAGDPHRASHGKEDEEGDHESEEPSGRRQGKAQNGTEEERLLERRVSGTASDQAAKHLSNAKP
ncbi:hypothetical protein P7K49_000180 [Saguinus oedipus]|uniref:Uncharacterized protein n=1 Tax=Saguinus oedipus TaxID=9490 RepID=A0ABQ9WCK4_SAGOE|nr:hypothetical protein P7K49_000180 [Saguinus oedipus]